MFTLTAGISQAVCNDMRIKYPNTEIPVDRKWHVLMYHEMVNNPGWFYYEMLGKNNVIRRFIHGLNIRFTTKVTVNGIEVAGPLGENITPGAHYGIRNRIIDVQEIEGVLDIRIWGKAASSSAKPGDVIEVVKMSLIYMKE